MTKASPASQFSSLYVLPKAEKKDSLIKIDCVDDRGLKKCTKHEWIEQFLRCSVCTAVHTEGIPPWGPYEQRFQQCLEQSLQQNILCIKVYSLYSLISAIYGICNWTQTLLAYMHFWNFSDWFVHVETGAQPNFPVPFIVMEVGLEVY